jgi:hypothetical protein
MKARLPARTPSSFVIWLRVLVLAGSVFVLPSFHLMWQPQRLAEVTPDSLALLAMYRPETGTAPQARQQARNML